MEAGVAHAERLEEVIVQIDVESLARDALDQQAQHVGGHRVVPSAARVELERQRCELLRHVVERLALALSDAESAITPRRRWCAP